MRVNVLADRPGTAAGQIFVAPYSTGRMVGQTGALVLDSAGDPVWFRSLPSPRLQNADFKVQSYRDPVTGATQPVLTFWQGTLAIPPSYTNLHGRRAGTRWLLLHLRPPLPAGQDGLRAQRLHRRRA